MCEMCGSNDIVKQDGYYVCQHCGTKYTVEEARKLIGTVKIDNSEELSNLYQLARRARNQNNAENAFKYYDQILVKDPTSWEATFFQVYYQAIQTKIMYISSAAYSVANNLGSTMNMISKISDTKTKENAISTVTDYSLRIANSLAVATLNHYKKFSETSGAHRECYERLVAIYSIYTSLENALKQNLFFRGDYIRALKERAVFLSNNNQFFDRQFVKTEMNTLSNEIKKFDPYYNAPSIEVENGPMVSSVVIGVALTILVIVFTIIAISR